MNDANKTPILREFQSAATGLRRAAQMVATLGVVETGWGPREVLAHIILWAVQATEHFRLHLPPLDYGDARIWGAELFGTFNAAFAYLAGPVQGPELAQQLGWHMVARAGIALPLTVRDTAEQHMRVDDAFNAAAVELVRGRPFHDILQMTEAAHANMLQLLAERPASDYEPGAHLYRRMALVITHHAEHRTQLEAQLAEATKQTG